MYPDGIVSCTQSFLKIGSSKEAVISKDFQDYDNVTESLLVYNFKGCCNIALSSFQQGSYFLPSSFPQVEIYNLLKLNLATKVIEVLKGLQNVVKR